MKTIIPSILIAIAIIGLAIFASKDSSSKNTETKLEEKTSVNNVNIIDGKQIIEIEAKGGYSPKKSFAQAGIPTIIRFKTNGTFDCSSSIRIPSMSVNKMLPQTGTTDIEIGTQATSTFNGSCGMGMYYFEIEFK